MIPTLNSPEPFGLDAARRRLDIIAMHAVVDTGLAKLKPAAAACVFRRPDALGLRGRSFGLQSTTLRSAYPPLAVRKRTSQEV